MIEVFVIISPFAILCLINLKTEWFFKVWIKTFLSLLLEEIIIAMILVVSFVNRSDNALITKLFFTGTIYALTKTNTYMYMLFGGISTSVQNNIHKFKMFNK